MAVTIDNTTTENDLRSETVTVSHLTSGTNRMMLVTINYLTHTGKPASMTYNGVSLTKEREIENVGLQIGTQLWSLAAPATGTNDLVITNDDSDGTDGIACVYTFNGSAGTISGTDDNSGDTSTQDPTIDITSAVGDMVIDVVSVAEGGVGTYTVGSGQTEVWNGKSAGVGAFGLSSYEAGASTVTMDWSTSDTNDIWINIGTSVNAGTQPPDFVQKAIMF